MAQRTGLEPAPPAWQTCVSGYTVQRSESRNDVQPRHALLKWGNKGGTRKLKTTKPRFTGLCHWIVAEDQGFEPLYKVYTAGILAVYADQEEEFYCWPKPVGLPSLKSYKFGEGIFTSARCN